MGKKIKLIFDLFRFRFGLRNRVLKRENMAHHIAENA
jgi:hypothetical protein